MIRKYLFIVFTLLIPFVPVNGFAVSVDLSLFTGGLSLLDSLFLIALGLVLIGVLLLCIAFLKPEKALPQETDDIASAENASGSSSDENEAGSLDTVAEGTEEGADAEGAEKAEGAETAEETSVAEEKPEENLADEAGEDENKPEVSAGPETEVEPETESEAEKKIEKVTITLTGVKSGELKILPVIDRALIGRSMKNDVVIPDATVSGIHCEFIYRDGRTYLRDRNSTNGTYLNGKRIFDNTEVHKGDILTIGQSEFKIGI